jgi:sulfoxide reductase catalytic subunit YedY
MKRITIGTDSATNYTGLLIGTGIIVAIIAFCFFAHWLSWNKQQLLQYLQTDINGTLWRITVNLFRP